METDRQRTIANQCHQRIQARIREVGWVGLAADEQHFENTLAFYGDVEGNGLDSVFFNSYLGDMAEELLESLRAIGADKAAAIFERSFAYFPDAKVPVGLDNRAEVLRQKRDRAGEIEFFNKLCEEFYAEAEKRSTTLYRFILSHADDFEKLHGMVYREPTA